MTRHTTMIVGPTGGGKSVVLNTLAQAQTKYYSRLTSNLSLSLFVNVDTFEIVNIALLRS